MLPEAVEVWYSGEGLIEPSNCWVLIADVVSASVSWVARVVGCFGFLVALAYTKATDAKGENKGMVTVAAHKPLNRIDHFHSPAHRHTMLVTL